MTEENASRAVDLESIAKFLPDEPLADNEKDVAEFGHAGVAETLAAVVRRCDPPFTVALFGSWGTGKSSVVELLRGKLPPTIPTVVIDVWKFQDDSLRRTVLKELVGQGPKVFKQYDKSVKLSERVEASASVETDYKLGLLPAQVDKALEWQAPARLFPLLILLVAMNALLLVLFEPMIPSPTAQAAAIALALLAFVASVGILLVPKKLTVSRGRFDDPYDFQTEFNDVIAKGYKKAEKVLIVFDNLDRVENKKAVEVLTTIKTFLEANPGKGRKSRSVFLVPCDDDAIREQVQERFRDGDEFLRKFFNVSVKLPEFIGTELEGYALQQLTKTNIPALNNSQVAWMISKAFKSNPRQVKQFINVLVAEYLLANRRSISKELPPEFAKQNVLALTLFELLRTRFPEALDVELGRKPEHVDPQEHARLQLQRKEMTAFREEVAHYASIEDFGPWLTLRRSKYEAKLPGIDGFLVALAYADLRSAAEFLASIEDYPSAQNEFSCAVQDRADTMKAGTAFVEFLSTLLRVLRPEKRALNGTTMDQLLGRATRLVKGEPQIAVAPLDPLLVSERLQERDFGHSVFVDAWTGVLKNTAESKEVGKAKREFLISLTKVLSSHDNWFEDRSGEIAGYLPTVAGKDDELLRILAEGDGAETWIDPPVAYAFADYMSAPAGVVGELPESVPVANPELFAERIELLRMLPSAAIIDTVASRVLRADVQVMDGSNNSDTAGEAWLSLVRSCHASLGIVGARVAEGVVEDEVLNDFTRVVKNVLNSTQNAAAHREAIETLIDLGNTGHHPNRGELIGFISSFIAQGPTQDVRSIVRDLGGPAMPGWTECRPHLLGRCTADTALYDGVLEDTPEEGLFDWIAEMLPRIPEHVLRSIPGSRLTEHDTMVVCEHAGDLTRELVGDPLISLLDAMAPLLHLDGMDCALRDFANGLGQLLTTGNEELAAPALRLLGEYPEHLSNPELAVGLVSRVVGWLGGYGDRFQPSAVSAVLLLQERLTPEERDSLVGLLFGLATDDQRPPVVRYALESVAALGVRFEERPANFIHVQNRYGDSADLTMKEALRDGLVSLRPKPMPRKTKSEARAFWEWQKSLR
jgi:hypothetical protein